MACSATIQPLLNFELSHSHQPKRPYSLPLCSFIKKPRLSPKHFFSQSKDYTKINIFSSPSLFSRQKPGSHVAAQSDYSSGEEAESLLPDSAYQEPFSWSSVILPFLFPALGGLLFGYDIGATSGATISLQSPELSGTTWFNLSAIQLGLVVSGSLYGALLGSLLVYPIADSLGRRRELLIAALLYVLGGVLTAFAPGLSVLLVGRLLYGLGIGLGPSLKAFIIGGGLVLFQQITGQPSVLYYAGPILQANCIIASVKLFLQSAGFSAAADATRLSVVVGLFKLLMTWIAVAKVDDLGRRPLLIGGVGGIALSLFLLCAYYKFLGEFPYVAVAALLLYISFGPISWLMVSEIFPLRTRGKGISLAVLTNFGSNAIVTFAFSPLKELLGAENLFLLFGVIALISLLFVALYVPETKGLSLEEIESKILK
ncbi:hypothetical protein GOBAR_DD29721 [Gossypium barbadense]|nr:hypothetical protein GOBAR_DD29721 [Gossypium barbadense]